MAQTLIHTEFDRAYFERMAELEDRHPWTRSMRRLTFALLGRWGTAGSVLDVGCGTGLFLHEWQRLAKPVRAMGVDFAFPALQIAMDRAAACWAGASADALPLQASQFDAVHSADVLQHMTVAGAAESLREFHRVLRPGGLLALRLRATRRLIPSPEDEDYNHAYSPARLRAELAGAGFEVVFLRRVNCLPSLAEELVLRLRPSTHEDAPVKGISLRAAEDWRSRVLAAYLALECVWLLAGLPSLPVGHTLVALARKQI